MREWRQRLVVNEAEEGDAAAIPEVATGEGGSVTCHARTPQGIIRTCMRSGELFREQMVFQVAAPLARPQSDRPKSVVGVLKREIVGKLGGTMFAVVRLHGAATAWIACRMGMSLCTLDGTTLQGLIRSITAARIGLKVCVTRQIRPLLL